MIKIAYITSRFPKLSETFVFREINALNQQGAEVSCFSIHRPTQEPLPSEAQHFLKTTTYLWPPSPARFLFGVLRIAATRPREFFGTLKLFLQRAPRHLSGVKRFTLHFLEGAYLAHLCEQRQIEYIHAHFANGPSSVAMAANALTGIPFGFTCHAQDIFADPLMLDLKIKKARIPQTISQYNRDYIVKNFPLENAAKLKVHRVAVDLDQFRPSRAQHMNNDSPVILAVGRLVRKKGFIHLIRACEILAQRGVNFRCWIIGEGPERAALQAAISASKLEEKVCLLGAQTEIKKYLQRADVFIMPCVLDESGDRDGIPTTLMEAMAMRVPVISTNISGIPELIQHEKTGLLVPPADAETLAQAICRLIVDERLRQFLVDEARLQIEFYHNLETNTQNFLHTILQQISKNSGGDDDDTDPFDPTPVAGWLPKLRSKIFSEDFHLQFA
jgi:glycosyltransferase involved in cell wall biosynthesis